MSCDHRFVLPRSIVIVGGLLVLIGLVMIPLPGPGALIVSLGLPVLVAGLVVSAVSRRRSSP